MVRIDTATARAALAEVSAEIEAITRTPHEVEIRPGQFRERLIAQVRAAEAALPAIDVEVATDASEIRLARLRAQIAAIPERLATDATFDDAQALAALRVLQAELAELNRRGVRIDVRADAAAAQAELAAVAASVEALDAKHPKIKVDTAGASSAVMTLGIQLAALVGIGGLPVIAGGLGAIAAAAFAAAGGVGVLALAAAPAVRGVAQALQAQKAAQDQATSATTAGANAEVTAQQRALSLAGAQQSLAAARRAAAQQAQAAARQIEQAEHGLADATAQAAESRERAQRQVADAVAQAADAQVRAARQVADAERALADAQRGEMRAQADLTAARRTAADQLADLNDRLADGALAERDAVLRVQQAAQDLQAARTDPRASALQRAQAQLAFDQAEQHAKEQSKQYARLQSDAQAAREAGVEGADAVVSAQDRLVQAQQRTADQARALADAQAGAARTAAQSAQAITDAQANASKAVATSARQIADAQARIADAQRQAAQAQATAAESVANAQRGVQQALLSTEHSAGGAASAADKYALALGRLSPQARQLFDAIAGPAGLREAFKQWSATVSPDATTLLVRGVDAAKASLPGLTPIAEAATRAVDGLFDRAGTELKSPFWRGFKSDIDASVGPALTGLGVAFGNTLKGIAGLIDAFLPHMASISARLESITAGFANWSAGLKGSPEFEGFLAYASATAPALGSALGQIAGAVLAVGQALAPLSGPALEGIGWLAGKVADLATAFPALVQALWLGIAAFKIARIVGAGAAAGIALYNVAMAVATAETLTFDAALQATIIVPLIEAIVIALIALVAGVIYAYNHFTWFHNAVTAVWDGIRIGALFLWTVVLQPVFAAIWAGLQMVGAAALWLWENALGPAFAFIWEAAKILFAIVAVAVIAPLVIAFNILSAAGLWLWQNGLKPTFEGIAAVALFVWKWIIQPTFDAWMATFRALADLALWLWRTILQPAFEGIGAAASWAWRNLIKPAFDGIATGASWLWEHALQPAFEAIKGALTPVGEAFGKAKDMIGKAWGELQDITKKPVNFLIETVYTNGIKAVWDKVADFVHLPHLPDGPKLLAAGGTVGPGWGEAVPMVVNRPTAIVGEGNPRFPEYVIPTDPRYRARALALHAAAGTQLMADGGILGKVWGTITDVVGDGVDLLKDGADLLTNPGKIWDKVTGPVRALFAKIGESPMAKAVIGIPTQMLTGLKDKVVSFVGGGKSTAPAAGSGVQRWAPVVQQALTMLGQPQSWLDTVLRRMNQESGGDPNVVNRWDSNWQAGTPSVGLMQVIGPTFRAYADAFRDTGPFQYGTSTDPLANTYAGLNYAIHRYGSLSALNRLGGYDSGGYLPTGTSLVYNHTGRPEPVLTTGQWDTLSRAAATGAAPGDLEVHVWVGDREITDIVRTEVRAADTATARALTTGRRI